MQVTIHGLAKYNALVKVHIAMEEYEGNLTVHEDKNKNIRHIFLFFNDKTFKTELLHVFLFER